MSCAEQFIRKLLRKLNSPVYAHLLLHRSLQESMKSFVIIISRLCLPTLAVTFLFYRSERSTLENTKGPFPWTVLPLHSSVRDSRATSSVMFFLVPQPEVISLALSLSRLVTTPFLHPSPFHIPAVQAACISFLAYGFPTWPPSSPLVFKWADFASQGIFFLMIKRMLLISSGYRSGMVIKSYNAQHSPSSPTKNSRPKCQ